MPYRLFTLIIDESSGGFDDQEFHEFTRAHFIVSAKQEILMYKNVPYMAIFVEYRNKKKIHPTKYFSNPSKKDPEGDDRPLTPKQMESYEQLRKWRNEKAIEKGIPTMNVLHNIHLKEIVRRNVRSKGELLKISGIGKGKAEAFCTEILRILHHTPSIEDVFGHSGEESSGKKE